MRRRMAGIFAAIADLCIGRDNDMEDIDRTNIYDLPLDPFDDNY